MFCTVCLCSQTRISTMVCMKLGLSHYGMNRDWVCVVGMNRDWVCVVGMNRAWVCVVGMNRDWVCV